MNGSDSVRRMRPRTFAVFYKTISRDRAGKIGQTHLTAGKVLGKGWTAKPLLLRQYSFAQVLYHLFRNFEVVPL